MKQIRDIMTTGVSVVQRDDTLQTAAQRMRDLDIGSLPVRDGKALVGMVTDRDIVIRGVAVGMVAQESLVSDVMTDDVRCCRADDAIADVLREMGEAQVRRLPVLDDSNEIVGIVALADLATRQSGHIDDAVREISSPRDPQAGDGSD